MSSGWRPAVTNIYELGSINRICDWSQINYMVQDFRFLKSMKCVVITRYHEVNGELSSVNRLGLGDWSPIKYISRPQVFKVNIKWNTPNQSIA